MQTLGGPTIAHMQLYTIVWAGDETQGASLDRFHGDLFASSWWSGLAEYGVGAATARGVIVLPAPRPTALDDSSFAPIIDSLVQSGSIVKTADTVVAFYVAPDVAMYDGVSMASFCMSAGGFHSEASTPFIVDLPCAPPQGTSVMDNLTWTDSHEVAESASDPHPNTAPAWQNPWLGGFGEIGDMCNDVPVTIHTVDDAGARDYLVTRYYSGVQAQAGNDPCLPARPGAYFNVGLDPSNIVLATDANGHAQATVQLVPFTHGGTFAMDWFVYTSAPVTTTPLQGTNLPGDVVTLTITTTAGPQAYPTWFTVLVRDPNDPTQWGQEWIASITIN